MKQIIIALGVFVMVVSCHSQQKNKDLPVEQKMPVPIQKVDFSAKHLEGKWFNTESFSYNNQGKSTLEARPCQENSYWQISPKGEGLVQSFYTAKGKDCKEFINTPLGEIKIEGENLIYFSGDVGKSVRLKELTKNRLVVVEKDIVNRQVVEIEKVYNKK